MAQPPFPQPQPEPNFPGRPEDPGLPQPGGEPRLPEPDWGSPVPGEGRPGGDPEPHTPGRQPGGAGEPGIPGGGGVPGGGYPDGEGSGELPRERPGELPREGEPRSGEGERRGGDAGYGGGGGGQWPPQPRGPQRPDNRPGGEGGPGDNHPGGNYAGGPASNHPGGNYPGGSGGPGDGDRKDDAPEQVRTAWILYIMAAVAAVLASATALLPGGRSVSVEQVREAVPGGMSEYSDEQLQAAATLTGIIGVILVVVVSALFLLAARQLFKGKQWARALLTVGSIVLIAQGLAALLVLFAGGSPAGAPAQADPVPNFIELAASVCAGLFAGTALWQLYTKDSTAFFQERSGVGKS